MENKRSRKTPSRHDTFPKFLDCVSEFSVPEELSLRGGTWMGGPPGPCHKLSTMEGKEPLKYIWDHLGEFIKKGRKEIQVYLERNLDETTSKIIANAVQSCIWEHSEELKSDDGQAEEVKQEIQDPQPGIPVPTGESEDQGAENLNTDGAKELAPTDEANTTPEIPEGWWKDEEIYRAGHTITGAARILNVRRRTIYKWIEKGAIKRLPTGRIAISELKRVSEMEFA